MAAAPAVASAILRVSACLSDGSLRRMRVPVVSSVKKLRAETLGRVLLTYGIAAIATSEAETRYVNASNQKTHRRPRRATNKPANAGAATASTSVATRESERALTYCSPPTTSRTLDSKV